MARGMNKGSLLLASAVAGMIAFAGAATSVSAEESEQVNCYGVNKCKGAGACGGKGQGYLKIDQETCLQIEGGRLTPQPAEK